MFFFSFFISPIFSFASRILSPIDPSSQISVVVPPSTVDLHTRPPPIVADGIETAQNRAKSSKAAPLFSLYPDMHFISPKFMN